MMRANVLEKVGGYREDLVAGEEPELCVRLRLAGWHIWRLNSEMTLHDANMTSFGQWWRRNIRSGYAFAQGAHIHGAPPERHWVWESRRARLWGIWLPIACLTLGLIIRPYGFAAFLVFPLQMLRRLKHTSGPFYLRLQLAFFELLARFPEAAGQIKFAFDRLLERQGALIEYK